MSPRAAWRLESLGFRTVYDYVAGKADWAAFGLPLEGEAASRPTAGALARRDVPTCRLDESLRAVRERVRAAGWDTCVVVNEGGVVLGRLGRRALASQDDVRAEAAMTSGPSTIRPDRAAAAAVDRLRAQGLAGGLVTRSDGTLVGVVLVAPAPEL